MHTWQHLFNYSTILYGHLDKINSKRNIKMQLLGNPKPLKETVTLQA